LVWDNVVVGAVFTVIAGAMGLLFMLLGAYLVPKIVDSMTPNINEEKEMVRGNLAVANYFGRVVQAAIIGMSIIIAAAIIAGFSG
jgi:hypothetical protein